MKACTGLAVGHPAITSPPDTPPSAPVLSAPLYGTNSPSLLLTLALCWLVGLGRSWAGLRGGGRKS